MCSRSREHWLGLGLPATRLQQASLGRSIIDAFGSAFFSLSLGVGTMLIYGSYLSDRENIPGVGAQVALVDIGIAVLAGFLILPAMYVADARGVAIFNSSGGLLSEDTLIFTVLPALFDTMDGIGVAAGNRVFHADEHRGPHLLDFHAGSARRLSD